MSVFIALLLQLGILLNENDYNPDMFDTYQTEIVAQDVSGI
jgi:hypothetical protein